MLTLNDLLILLVGGHDPLQGMEPDEVFKAGNEAAQLYCRKMRENLVNIENNFAKLAEENSCETMNAIVHATANLGEQTDGLFDIVQSAGMAHRAMHKDSKPKGKRDFDGKVE